MLITPPVGVYWIASSTMRNALIVAAVVVFLGGGYYAWQTYGGKSAQEPAPAPEPVSRTYATSTFAIRYPSDFTADDSYLYDRFEGKPIAGVKFGIPASMAAGTNLLPDTYLSVEWLPRAKNCTGDIYVVPDVRAFELAVGSTTYSAATTTGAAAGNAYEERVFAIGGSKPCTAVRYFLHSGNVGNYPEEGEGGVRGFDSALLAIFDRIRDSLVLNQ